MKKDDRERDHGGTLHLGLARGASYRVMGPAMVMGHAAGVAAALAAARGETFRQLDVRLVQDELIRQGAFLG